MFAKLRRSLLLGGIVSIVACSAWAQVTTLEGDVKDGNGQPVKDAVIDLHRTDIKGNYHVKSNKKGHWFYTGLPLGTYDITCSVNGQVVDKVNGVKTQYGDSGQPINFNTAKMQQAQAAAQAGQATDDQTRGMSKEEKAKLEAQMKERSEAIKKNKALNDAFTAGIDALKAQNYQVAADSLTKASELDPTQIAVWQNLGEAYAGLAKSQTGDQQTQSYDKAVAAYKKSLELKPDDAGTYNQLGNLYGAEKKLPEAQEALTKAAQLDPAMAAKANFNIGALLVNSGKAAEAAPYFKKAVAADPNYAEADYQLGSTLMMQGTVDPKTGTQTYPPETAPALQKYLELQPNGPHAQEAQAMLQALGEKVQTNIHNPAATTPSRKRSK
jgi:tetratricopeptide (TPR) repeat protein